MTNYVHRIYESSTVNVASAQTVSLIRLRRVHEDIPPMSIVSI